VSSAYELPTLRPCDNCGQFAYIVPELDPHTGEYCDDCSSVPGVATMSTRCLSWCSCHN